MPEDRRQMRYRSFVLHNLLKNCVQRRSHRVLQNDLPEKLEFVILVKLTPKQIPYYSSFTKISGNNSEEGMKKWPHLHIILWCLGNMNAVVAYATCAKIWNHPDLLYNSAMKDTDDAEDFEGLDLEDFNMDGISSGPRKTKKTKKVSKISSESTEWAKNCGILQNHIPGDVMAGYKVPILLSILAKGSSPAQTQPKPYRRFILA